MLTFISSLTAQNKGLRKPIPIEDLLPDYLGTRDEVKRAEKSIEMQRQEFSDFMMRLNKAKAYAQGKTI